MEVEKFVIDFDGKAVAQCLSGVISSLLVHSASVGMSL